MRWNGTNWGATGSERRARYPCDSLVDGPCEGWYRAVDVEASAAVVFAWLTQLRIAPYSYDWIDFTGRRSPRRLLSGQPPLARGQRFLVFDLVSFDAGRHLTGVLPASAAARFGAMAVTYRVDDLGGRSRLVVKVAVAKRHAVLRRLLAWGDLVMMRKQLLTLKELAEGPSTTD